MQLGRCDRQADGRLGASRGRPKQIISYFRWSESHISRPCHGVACAMPSSRPPNHDRQEPTGATSARSYNPRTKARARARTTARGITEAWLSLLPPCPIPFPPARGHPSLPLARGSRRAPARPAEKRREEPNSDVVTPLHPSPPPPAHGPRPRRHPPNPTLPSSQKKTARWTSHPAAAGLPSFRPKTLPSTWKVIRPDMRPIEDRTGWAAPSPTPADDAPLDHAGGQTQAWAWPASLPSAPLEAGFT